MIVGILLLISKDLLMPIMLLATTSLSGDAGLVPSVVGLSSYCFDIFCLLLLSAS